ncbi:hypothetical protein Tsubulata_038932 [Turnera subulata]|uniref:Uncharacterized protein n=1 Tax=Turnera subulata TaxID=218843 RepID=A0A9Q0GA18_9ROSI|nr:hypothetical protein Tsubulata_038932 [Turnera subulata]
MVKSCLIGREGPMFSFVTDRLGAALCAYCPDWTKTARFDQTWGMLSALMAKSASGRSKMDMEAKQFELRLILLLMKR